MTFKSIYAILFLGDLIMIKMPPIAKIYEAFTCIADKRIQMNEKEAIVSSSDGKKNYKVKWKNNIYVSNDNASYWQGYPGYPIIAILLLQNKLTYNEEIILLFKKINWHDLNEKYNRNYDKAVEEVLNNISYDSNIIKKETEKIFEQIKDLDIQIKKKLEE